MHFIFTGFFCSCFRITKIYTLFLMQILASNINKASGKKTPTPKGYTLSEFLLFYYMAFISTKTQKQFCLLQ